MEKVWEVKDPDALLRDLKKKRTTEQPLREEKDPAGAYSRSLLVWGLGQLYNDQLGKGASFMVAMMLLAGGVVLGVIYRDEFHRFLLGRGISRASAFLAAEAALCAVLLFWTFNAADAYHAAARTRRKRFSGVPSRVTPFLGSLCFPGWGQYLNGQPLKGALFAGLTVLGSFSILSAALTFLVWPALEASDARFLIEGISAVALFAVPAVPLLWAVGCYDALAVSREELLKEPLWERLKAAYYRGRTQGWVRGVFPNIRRVFLAALILAVLVLAVSFWFPKDFYAGLLRSLQRLLAERGMTILPELITRSLEAMGS